MDKVKKSESGMIVDPVTVEPDATAARRAVELMREHGISGVPVVRRRQAGRHPHQPRPALRDATSTSRSQQVMTDEAWSPRREGVTIEEAKELLHQHRIEKLLVVDEAGELRGLITIKDIEKTQQHPNAAKDELGRLRVRRGRRRGRRTGRSASRRCSRRACDVIVRRHRPRPLAGRDRGGARHQAQLPKGVELIAGNVATAEAADAR